MSTSPPRALADLAQRAVSAVRPGPSRTNDREHTITVHRSPVDVTKEAVARLRDLDGVADVTVRPAPGSWGTEIAVRMAEEPSGVASLAARVSGDDPRHAVRTALREVRSVLETGEVLQSTSPGSTEPTATNAALRWATRHGRGEGRL